MGFWESFGNIAGQAVKGVTDACEKKAESINRRKMRFERLDDEALIQKYRHCSGDDKIACAMLLKERGYGNSN